MVTLELRKSQIFKLLDVVYNPPKIADQKDENRYQAEIRGVYNHLIILMEPFGEEGEIGYGDFALRPWLKVSPRLTPRAPHCREFWITVLSRDFWDSNYLSALCEFVQHEAKEYRFVVHQDFDVNWTGFLIITADKFCYCCTSREELARIREAIENL
jgi:hypothetical protein